MSFDWKSIVRNVAPALGNALGGPVAGIATKFIADKLLGKPDATESEIANAIQFSSPEHLVKLKELDNIFELEMSKLGVDIYRIEAQDTANARQRQKDMHDWTPNIIAILYLIGFFIIIWWLGRDGVLEQENMLISRLQDGVLIMLGYFFGSSARSRVKDFVLSKLNK